MRRRDALRALIDHCRETGALSVSTMQATPVWHELAPAMPDHVDMLGCMGSASSFALGLALGAPGRRVIVVDGDGSLMMQLGTLVTVGHARATNLTIVVMRNGTYETSGNQTVPGTHTADLRALAKAAGFATAGVVTEAQNLPAELTRLAGMPGPRLLVLDIEREEPCAKWPSLSMKQQMADLRSTFVDASSTP